MQQHINQTITEKLWSGGDADARQISYLPLTPHLQPLSWGEASFPPCLCIIPTLLCTS